MRLTENTRLTPIEPWYVDANDMRQALGPLYDPSIPLPDARYIELSLIDSYHEQQLIQMELISGRFSESGPHREKSWSDAWTDRLQTFANAGYEVAALDPPYVSAHAIVRWMGSYIRATSENFEMRVYEYIRESLFRKFMSDASIVHDVGAGTCFNSAAYLKLYPKSTVYAYDWAPATEIISDLLRQKHGMNIRGRKFDFYKPDLCCMEDDVVMTTCAMEQIGEDWRPFLDNLLTEKPRRVVHLEPIYEKYEEDRGYDSIAREYHRQRKYLRGYYPELKKLAAEGKIRILCDHRTGIGSRFHECYTVIVWELV